MSKNSKKTRKEKDFLGELDVPADAYFGIQTWRAVSNFPISGIRMPPVFNRAYAEIKKAAALTHRNLGVLPVETANAIIDAADEIISGVLEKEFVVDVFQAGAGTSHHMNVNEVIANRASEMLGEKRGEYIKVHPNDHVNMGQSTNDSFPTAMRLAALFVLPELMEELKKLARSLGEKAKKFKNIVKSGRTHLQDAVPMSLGQEFSGYSEAVLRSSENIDHQSLRLRELGIGGSAAGTGVNTHRQYRKMIVQILSENTGLTLKPSKNLFESMQSMAPFVNISGALRSSAVELGRISNDFRLLSSGPATGLSEIRLPSVQPGSSIMPGKVNPVIAECMNMICFQVIGNDTCISEAASAGQLELNVMMPVICFDLLWSIQILTNGVRMLRERSVDGIEADRERCAHYLNSSVGLATVLNPVIGYHNAAGIAKEAVQTGKSIRHIVLEKGLMSEDEFDDLIRRSL